MAQKLEYAAPRGSQGAPLPSEPFPPGYRWRRGRNWFFLGLLYAGFYLCRLNLSTVTPEMGKEFGLNNKQLGQMSTGRDFGYAIGTFTNGLFADAIGGKQAMAVGALGTILLNLVFFGFSNLKWEVATLLAAFVIVRTVDGYIQAFGSPGMVKINTSWFKRRERGKFAGVFGGMIQMGHWAVNQLSSALLSGFALTLFGVTIFSVAAQNWRTMFIVPPIMLFVILILAWLNVKNHPEEAGFLIRHDEDAHQDKPHERLATLYVLKTITKNPLIWINAGAYFCTGFVRAGYTNWWIKYMLEEWHVGKGMTVFVYLSAFLPFSGFAGSFGSGWISDALFKGRRSPVAAILYGIETIIIILSFLALGPFKSSFGGPIVATISLLMISLTCSSSHSIIGTAAVMDIGGRKMSGFALGVVNSFQYWGAMLAGWFVGGLIDKHGWSALFASMIPFSAFGMLLMASLAFYTRGRDVKGA